MELIKEIQKLINEIDYQEPKEETLNKISNEKRIKFLQLEKILLENDLIYTNEIEKEPFLNEFRGQFNNELLYRYTFSYKNKKRAFKQLIKKSI